ncbi:conserved hypothetical protein [Burkholderiales bacterium 8X]|nr:conserved hypothetical protein [Burkholderiales bacterium 8X]
MAAAAFWTKWGVAMLALLLGFLAFYAYVTRKPPVVDAQSTVTVAAPAVAAPAPARAAAAAAAAPPATTSTSGSTEILTRSSSPSASVPIASTLDAGEVAIESKAPNLPAPTTLASSRPAAAGNPARVGTTSEFAPAPPPPSAQERSTAQRAPQPTRRDAMDPRRGCEGLSFIFAARCEAANCDKAAFTRHPRCDAVREERKRDEARRNPTLGF